METLVSSGLEASSVSVYPATLVKVSLTERFLYTVHGQL